MPLRVRCRTVTASLPGAPRKGPQPTVLPHELAYSGANATPAPGALARTPKLASTTAACVNEAAEGLSERAVCLGPRHGAGASVVPRGLDKNRLSLIILCIIVQRPLARPSTGGANDNENAKNVDPPPGSVRVNDRVRRVNEYVYRVNEYVCHVNECVCRANEYVTTRAG